MTNKKDKKEESFQESFLRLEHIVKTFESGALDLDQSLEKFEEGLILAAVCKKRLAEVENKVIDLKKKFGALDGDHTEELGTSD